MADSGSHSAPIATTWDEVRRLAKEYMRQPPEGFMLVRDGKRGPVWRGNGVDWEIYLRFSAEIDTSHEVLALSQTLRDEVFSQKNETGSWTTDQLRWNPVYKSFDKSGCATAPSYAMIVASYEVDTYATRPKGENATEEKRRAWDRKILDLQARGLGVPPAERAELGYVPFLCKTEFAISVRPESGAASGDHSSAVTFLLPEDGGWVGVLCKDNRIPPGETAKDEPTGNLLYTLGQAKRAVFASDASLSSWPKDDRSLLGYMPVEACTSSPPAPYELRVDLDRTVLPYDQSKLE